MLIGVNEPANERYEIVSESTAKKRRFFGYLGVLISNLLAYGDGPANPGGRIIVVRDKHTGEELFRHIEDWGDDNAHLLGGIQADLDTMTAEEFAHTWTS